MKLFEKFKNVFTYAAGMQNYVTNMLGNSGYQTQFVFAQDFAIADAMSGKKGVMDTYKAVKESWLCDYKAFTEAVMQINGMAWAHHQLKQQGVQANCDAATIYSELYYKAMDDFYDRYRDNEEATDYFFRMTD